MSVAIGSYAHQTAFAPMPRVSFKGDQESHLTDLILASQTKAVDDAVLKERALVPFFDDSPVDSAALQPLQGKAGPKKAAAHDKGRKAGPKAAQPMAVDSAGAKQTRRKKGAKAAPAEAAAPAQPTRKHHRDPSYRHLPGLAPSASAGGGAAVSGRQSPPRKRQESQFYDTASSAPPAASRFAGPAFTNSPMPDTLPIPTTSLLLDGLML